MLIISLSDYIKISFGILSKLGVSLVLRDLIIPLKLRKKFPYSELFWSAFFPDFPAFGLNTEKYGVILVRIFSEFFCIRTEYGEILNISPYSVRIRENAGKIRTRITPNTDSFYAVLISSIAILWFRESVGWY